MSLVSGPSPAAAPAGASRRRYGLVGDAGEPGIAALLARVRALAADAAQCPAFESLVPTADATPRSLSLYALFRAWEADGAAAVVLPQFADYVHVDALQGEVGLPVVSLFDALRAHLAALAPAARRIGILGDGTPVLRRLLAQHLGLAETAFVFAGGEADGSDPARLADACRTLLGDGAEVIVPESLALAVRLGTLPARAFPLVDLVDVYAGWIVSKSPAPVRRAFKIGIVGGVGPAATVDLLAKIVRATDARRDQEHLKVVVEQNPQIPDRTEHLLHGGPDPTLALYATCRRLQDDAASVIAIPCNTAHAFVDRIQPYLTIPIINMLHETMAHIRRTYPELRTVGLLATSGTVRSGVYHDAAAAVGCTVLVPDEAHQALVMDAIYGPRGVKAGFTDGDCASALQQAMASLVQRGAQVLILGCTELPLIVAQHPAYPVAGDTVALVDPTEVLARACVARARRAD